MTVNATFCLLFKQGVNFFFFFLAVNLISYVAGFVISVQFSEYHIRLGISRGKDCVFHFIIPSAYI